MYYFDRLAFRDIHRFNVVDIGDMIGHVHQRTDTNDNPRSRDHNGSSASIVTISSNNYSRPSETLVVEAKVFPVGDKMAAVEQTINDVIEAHLVTSIHTAESVRRGILLCAAINKQQKVCI